MRCNDCGKFVSNGEPEAEVQGGEDFEAEIAVSVKPGEDGKSFDKKILLVKCNPDVRVVVPCGECGSDLKDATFNKRGSK